MERGKENEVVCSFFYGSSGSRIRKIKKECCARRMDGRYAVLTAQHTPNCTVRTDHQPKHIHGHRCAWLHSTRHEIQKSRNTKINGLIRLTKKLNLKQVIKLNSELKIKICRIQKLEHTNQTNLHILFYYLG